MKYGGGGGASAGNTTDNAYMAMDGNIMEFPLTDLYELDPRVLQDNCAIPYKRDESLGKHLIAVTKLDAEGLLEQDENCKKFVDGVMTEAFK